MTVMNEARFMVLLSAYGADLSRWPEDDRDNAGAFLEVAPHRIKDVWESERGFDHLLALEKDMPVSIALETHVLAAAPGRRAAARGLPVFSLRAMPRWATGGALAASLALGFAVGYAGEPQREAVTDYAHILSLSNGGAGSVYLTAIKDGED
jgi:hypothetical protein